MQHRSKVSPLAEEGAIINASDIPTINGALSRRQLVAFAGMLGISLLAPGCGGGSSSSSAGTGGTGAPGGTGGNGGTGIGTVDSIYFASNRAADGSYHIYSINSDGTSIADVTPFDPVLAPGSATYQTFDPTQLEMLSFSSDGTGVVGSFAFKLYPVTGIPNLNEANGLGLVYLNLTTGAFTNLLTKLSLMAGNGIISPDGKTVMYTPIYQTDTTGAQIYGIVIANVDGTNPTTRYSTTVSTNAYYPFAFGTDGVTIYVVQTSFVGSLRNFKYGRIDPGSNTVTPITMLPSNLGHPNISPDGTKLLQSGFAADEEVAICNVDGTNPKFLTSGSSNDGSAVFIHSGAKIAFVSDRDGNDEIYVMNVDGSSQTRLTYNASTDIKPFTRSSTRKIKIRVVH